MRGFHFKQDLGVGGVLGVCNNVRRNGMLHHFFSSNRNFAIIRTTVVDIESPIYRHFSLNLSEDNARATGTFRNQFLSLAQFVSQNEYEKKNT